MGIFFIRCVKINMSKVKRFTKDEIDVLSKSSPDAQIRKVLKLYRFDCNMLGWIFIMIGLAGEYLVRKLIEKMNAFFTNKAHVQGRKL